MDQKQILLDALSKKIAETEKRVIQAACNWAGDELGEVASDTEQDPANALHDIRLYNLLKRLHTRLRITWADEYREEDNGQC